MHGAIWSVKNNVPVGLSDGFVLSCVTKRTDNIKIGLTCSYNEYNCNFNQRAYLLFNLRPICWLWIDWKPIIGWIQHTVCCLVIRCSLSYIEQFKKSHRNLTLLSTCVYFG